MTHKYAIGDRVRVRGSYVVGWLVVDFTTHTVTVAIGKREMVQLPDQLTLIMRATQ